MVQAVRGHWPEYLMEAAGLGLFMISACGFGALLGHPVSPAVHAIADPGARRLLMGLAMGSTAAAIIYSPWGRRSGAHLNPSTSLTFFRLGKVKGWDALFYVLAQFMGGLAGVLLMAALLGNVLRDPSVEYVVTVPGPAGAGAAFVAEVIISLLLMTVVLKASNTPRLARYTGIFAGALVAASITFEAPISGMSMNPARTFASALPAGTFSSLWVYFAAPPLGMLLAAEAYTRLGRKRAVACAKLIHDPRLRYIFCGHTPNPSARRQP